MAADPQLAILLSNLKASPNDPLDLCSLGRFYIGYGEIKKAELYFKQALAKNRAYWHGYTGLSEVYLYKNEFKKAEEEALKVLNYAPELKGHVYSIIGRIRFHAQDYSGAEAMLNKSIENNDPSRAYYAHALLGQLYIREGKLKDAEEELVRARSSQKDHAEIDELAMKIERYKRINRAH